MCKIKESITFINLVYHMVIWLVFKDLILLLNLKFFNFFIDIEMLMSA